MRGRAVAGATLAVALFVAVGSLRGTVEPSVAGSTTAPTPATSAPSPRVLPFRPAERAVNWRVYEVPPGTITARADPEHVMLSSIDEPGDGQAQGVLTVQARDGSGLQTSYRPRPAGWEPADWQLLDGALYVVEVLIDQGEGLGSRLMRVDLGSGLAREIPIRSVKRLAPSLLTVGDELIGTGTSAKNPIEQCAIAIRPSSGAERTVACGIVLPIIESADGGVLIKLPDNSPDGCAVRLLMPGRGEFGLPVFVGYCRQRQIIPLGGWQAYHVDGPGPAQPLLATDGVDNIVLGTAKIAAVACHGRLYWVSGGRKDSPYGVEVLRWTPGAPEVEVVYRSRGRTELGWPSCTEGTLGVPVRSSAADGSRLLALRVLDRP